MSNAETRLANNPVYHAIAIGLEEDIQAQFPWLTLTLGTHGHQGIEYPVLIISRHRETTAFKTIPVTVEQQIGLIFIQDNGIHFRGLTDFQNSHFTHYTTVLLESPRMDEEVSDAVCQMLHHANRHELMRDVMVSPMEKAGVGPGMDDD